MSDEEYNDECNEEYNDDIPRDDEMYDEEKRIDAILETLQQSRQHKENDRQHVQTVVETLLSVLSKDVIQYVFVSYIEVHEFPFFSSVEVSPRIQGYFQPYDLVPCEKHRALDCDLRYRSYFYDSEVTEKRVFRAKMLYIKLESYPSSRWYETRWTFPNDYLWNRRFYDVKRWWCAFHLFICPELEERIWLSDLYTLKWTYTLNGVMQPREIFVREIIKEANPFLWFELPEEDLQKGEVRVRMQLREASGELLFESQEYTARL